MLGFSFAYVGLRVPRSISPADLPRFDDLTVHAPVLLFAAAISGLACLLFAVAPAWVQAMREPNIGLRGGNGRLSETGRGKLQSALVIAEFALSIVLLAGAGLFFRSLLSVKATDPGIDARNVLLFQVDRDWTQPRERHAVFYSDLLSRLQALPGVTAAGAITDFFIVRNPDYAVLVEGRAIETREQVTVDAVSPGFLEVAGARLLRGAIPDLTPITSRRLGRW